jgi:hypothetical protein
MERKEQQSLNEAVRRVVLGEAKVKGKPIKLSPKEIKQYTLKPDGKTVNTSDKSGDDWESMDEYVTYDFDILYKGKKIGSGDCEDYFGEMWVEIDGVNAPKMDGLKGRGSSTYKMIEDSFRLFLKSKTFQKWSKNVPHFQKTYNKGN